MTYSGLAPGSHTLTVTGNGATPASASWTVDTSLPSVPTGLTANVVSSTQVNLAWTQSNDNIGVTGYDIYRNGTLLTTTSGTGTTYSDTSASPGKLYSYTVDARDGAGNVSAQSTPPATATTPTGPSGPTLVQVGLLDLHRDPPGGQHTRRPAGPHGRYVHGGEPAHHRGRPTGRTPGPRSWTSSVSGSNSAGELWYAPNAASVQSVTVTTGASTVALQLQEFSGVATTSPLDTSAGSAATSTSASSGSVTPGASGELAVGFVAGHSSTQSISITSPGFTADPQVTSTSPSKVSVISGYQDLTSTGAQSFNGSFVPAMYWAAGVALFKSGSAPPPPGDFSIAASPSAGSAVVGSPATSTVSTATISGTPRRSASTPRVCPPAHRRRSPRPR